MRTVVVRVTDVDDDYVHVESDEGHLMGFQNRAPRWWQPAVGDVLTVWIDSDEYPVRASLHGEAGPYLRVFP